MLNKIIVLLIFVMMRGSVFAQGASFDANNRRAFWEQKVDKTTEWGSWLTKIFKPYHDELSEMAILYLSPTAEMDMTGLSVAEIMKKINSSYSDYYKAVQNSIPPVELQKYHSILLELYAESIEGTAYVARNEEEIHKLVEEGKQELTRVFRQHKVPQKIIDEFMKIP